MPVFKAEDLDITNRRVHTMFVGRSGSGKSVAALFYPRPMYWICTDDRLGLLEGQKDITVAHFNSRDGWAELDKVLERDLINKIGRGPFPYKTVVLAGISSVIDLFVEDSMKFIQDYESTKGGSGLVGGALRRGSLLIPGLPNYLYVSSAMNQLFDNILAPLPCNVIVESHLVNDYDDKGNVQGSRVLATDKLSEKLPGKFDEVYEFTCANSAIQGRPHKYSVLFHSTIARSSLVNKLGTTDWTDKDFYNGVFLANRRK